MAADKLDIRRLSVPQTARLINTAAGRVVINDRQIRRHRERAGYTIGDEKKVDLLRYAAWLTLEFSQPKKPQKSSDYEAMKESARQRNAEASLSGRDIGKIPPVADPDRRARCEKNFQLYCETYHAAAFNLAWSNDHLKVIALLEEVILEGGLFALAMPRGSGKTTLCEVAAEWAINYGHRKFPVVVGTSKDRAKQILESIKIGYETNELLLADFPEVVFPIAALERIHNRAKGQLCCGEPTRIHWTESRIVFPTISGSKSSGSIICVTGIEGGVRGLKHTLTDGSSIRPDLAIIDDPQDEESAYSPMQNRKRIKTLNGAILNLAGPGKTIAAIMPCTVIQPEDMADQILDRKRNPRWQGQRLQLVYKFPTNEKLWEKYAELRRDSLEAGDKGKKATAFYRKNRKQMDIGADIAWPARFKAEELSAVQHAMNLKIDDEEVFYAEYQNDPQIEQAGEEILSAQEISSKLNGHDRGIIPLGCNHLTMFIDVQKAALFWVLAAWEENFTGYVIDYGTWPDQKRKHFALRSVKHTIQKSKPDSGLEGQLYFAMEQLAGEMLDKTYRRDDGAELHIDRCMIDANWGESTEVIYQFCRQSSHAGILIPAHGKAVGASSMPFAEYKRKKGDRTGLHWRIPNVQGRRQVRYVLTDVNYWKSFIHTRLGVSMGDKGCLSLFGHDAKVHELFSEHLTAEYCIKTEARGRVVNEWKLKPNKPDNHWFDCLVGAAVAASIEGVKIEGVGGQQGSRRKRKKYTQQDLQRGQ